MISLHTITRKFKARARGFTLIETLVAIAVLTIAIAAPLTITFRGMIATRQANEQSIATFLAEDGIEHVIAKKKQNIISTTGWLNGLGQCDRTSPRGCGFTSSDTGLPNPFGCSSITDNACRIYYNINTGMYGQDKGSAANFTAGWRLTNFIRLVRLETPPNPAGSNQERILISRVEWRYGNGTARKSYELRTNIYDVE